MSFVRARALQSLQNGLRQSRPALRNTTFRGAQAQTKRFASSGHDAKPSSDLPWLIGSIVVTVPGVYLLWPAPHEEHHGGHGDHDGHSEKHEEKHDEDSEEGSDEGSGEPEEKAVPSEGTPEPGEEAKPDPEEQAEKEQKKKGDDKDVPAEGEADAKPAKSSGNVEGVNFKGKVKEDSDGAQHSVKVESDSKGEKKKRLDSGLQKNLGPGHEQEGSDRDFSTMDGKQKGISNTQTRHSIPIHEDPEKSKKSDGSPETAKHIGTVDPFKK